MKKTIDQIKILIIEDDREKREELAEILYNIGFKLANIFHTKFAEEGIALINDELPDVVLLDLRIPYNDNDGREIIDNSNKVIKEVQRINLARNVEEDSTGIIIISASIDDVGIRNNYKHINEVVDFFDKDEIALNEGKFITNLEKKIFQVVERDFKQPCGVELKEIRNIKLKKLESINLDLYNRIITDLLGEFEKLNNKKSNINLISQNVIGLSGIIVEDILNLFDDKNVSLLPIDKSDNSNTVRHKLTRLTGREWDYDHKKYIRGKNEILSRKAAEYARFAYQLRSEVLHSKEGDFEHKKIFNKNNFTILDASISINLIMPLIQEFIEYNEKK